MNVLLFRYNPDTVRNSAYSIISSGFCGVIFWKSIQLFIEAGFWQLQDIIFSP